MRPAVLISCGAFGVASFLTATSCVDATHDAQVQALGGEAPGVPPGPKHRPGQPCLLCHGEAGPASGLFSVAGTVYETQGQTAPAVGADVTLLDDRGQMAKAGTNGAGNFFLTPSSFSPIFPVNVSVQQGMSPRADDAGAHRARWVLRGLSREPSRADLDGPGLREHGHATGGRPVTQCTLLALAAALGVTGAVASCSAVPADSRIGIIAPVDGAPFMPVADYLGVRCGSLDCHGQPGRNLRIWGCVGMRLDPNDISFCGGTGQNAPDDASRIRGDVPFARRTRADGDEHGGGRARSASRALDDGAQGARARGPQGRRPDHSRRRPGRLHHVLAGGERQHGRHARRRWPRSLMPIAMSSMDASTE